MQYLTIPTYEPYWSRVVISGQTPEPFSAILSLLFFFLLALGLTFLFSDLASGFMRFCVSSFSPYPSLFFQVSSWFVK